MDSDYRAIICVILLFIASAYCAVCETALASVSKTKIKVLSEKGNKRAEKVMYALDNFEDAITTLLICTNVAHIAAASLVTVLVTRHFGLNAVTLSTFATTLAMFFLGEMLPKSIGKKISTSVCLYTDGLLVVLMKILKPLSMILSGIGRLTLKIMGASEEVSVTEDEIYDIIEDMTEEGSLDEDAGDLISSALSFGDATVSSILTPRVDVSGFDINMPDEDILEFLKDQTHSRVIVYEKSVDHIVGILQIRKYLKAYISGRKYPDVAELMDEAYFVHQSTPIDELFKNMTGNKINLAVILDGYGGTLGIVTIEDILEEIVGEIWDEDDEIKEPIVALTDNVYIVNGDETVEDVFEFIHYEDPEMDKNEDRFVNLLVADWICEHFEEMPKGGDSFYYHDLKVTVSSIQNNRILKATIRLPEKPEAEEDYDPLKGENQVNGADDKEGSHD